MQRFKHGDHDCSVICTDLDDALMAGLLKPMDGKPVRFGAFAVGRAAYAFCSGCGGFSWSASEVMGGAADLSDIREDSVLTYSAVMGFRGSVHESCDAQRNIGVVREVMDS